MVATVTFEIESHKRVCENEVEVFQIGLKIPELDEADHLQSDRVAHLLRRQFQQLMVDYKIPFNSEGLLILERKEKEHRIGPLFSLWIPMYSFFTEDLMNGSDAQAAIFNLGLMNKLSDEWLEGRKHYPLADFHICFTVFRENRSGRCLNCGDHL